MIKKCNKCFVEKPLSAFFADKNHSSGRYSVCKVCKTEATLRWRADNKDLYNKGHREYARKHYRRLHLRRYRLTQVDYDQMLSKQNHVCAICGKPPKTKRRLCIDHCHKSSEVRGLLCYGCNRLMCLLDNAELYEKAKAYLRK